MSEPNGTVLPMAPAPPVVEQVRAALAEARAAGRPEPGRPTLIKFTGSTDYQVRAALRAVRAEVAAATTSAPGWRQAGGRWSPRQRPSRAHVWPLLAIGLGAAVAVWSGWVGLGSLTGFGEIDLLPGVFGGVHLDTAIVLPLSVEAYGAYALRVWLSSAGLSRRTRTYAAWSAIASLTIGAAAQAAYHLLTAAHVTSAPPTVTVLVACVPVLVLGLASALARLVHDDASLAADSTTATDDATSAA